MPENPVRANRDSLFRDGRGKGRARSAKPTVHAAPAASRTGTRVWTLLAALGAAATTACPAAPAESRSLSVLATRTSEVRAFRATARVVYEDAAHPGAVRWEQGFDRVELRARDDRVSVHVARRSGGSETHRHVLVRGHEVYAHLATLGGIRTSLRREGPTARELLDESYYFVDALRGYPWLRRVVRAERARPPAGTPASLARSLWMELDPEAAPPGSNYARLRVALDPFDGLPRSVRGGPFPENAREASGLRLERVFSVTSLVIGPPDGPVTLPAEAARSTWRDLDLDRDFALGGDLVGE
ncbi:MAG: hypothetical protein IT379_22215 [Deltaproteobacteria bacterium]|nr:hypothetical protein [Deltaproteobacteria bacterium]